MGENIDINIETLTRRGRVLTDSWRGVGENQGPVVYEKAPVFSGARSGSIDREPSLSPSTAILSPPPRTRKRNEHVPSVRSIHVNLRPATTSFAYSPSDPDPAAYRVHFNGRHSKSETRLRGGWKQGKPSLSTASRPSCAGLAG